MTERDHILDHMSPAELDLFREAGGTLSRLQMQRLNQWKADQIISGPNSLRELLGVNASAVFTESHVVPPSGGLTEYPPKGGTTYLRRSA